MPCNGLRLLDRLGVYNELVRRAATTTTGTLYSSRGEPLGDISLGLWSAKQTGYAALRVRRTDLMDVLATAVLDEGIPVHYGKRLTAINDSNASNNGHHGQVEVVFADGTSDTADMLLGCDGIHSAVRSLYVDPAVVPEYTGISTMYGFVSTSDLPPSSITNVHGATFTPHGLFGVIPCTAAGDVLYWLLSYEVPIPSASSSTSADTATATASRDGWEEHAGNAEDSFKSILLSILSCTPSTSPWGKLMRDVVDATKTVKFFPVFRIPPPSPSSSSATFNRNVQTTWFRGRCLLLGDAAHAISPHVGQGVSQALEDVFLLSRLLLLAQPNAAPPPPEKMSLATVFEKFTHIRRPRVDRFSRQATSRGNQRRQTGPWTHWARELLFWVALTIYRWTGAANWGLGEADVVYDIDEVEIT